MMDHSEEQDDEIERAIDEARKQLEDLDMNKDDDEYDLPFGEDDPEGDKDFLEQMEQFERMFVNTSTTSVWEHIGKPDITHRDDLSLEEMEAEIARIFSHMATKELFLDTCQKIDVKEFYDFLFKDFMHHQCNDMHVPGMNTRYIYEEFFPEKYPFEDSAYGDDLLQDPIKDLIKNPGLN